MKNHLYRYLMIASLSCLTVGCSDDVLDEFPKDKLSSEKFWTNPEDAENSLVVAYERLNLGFWSHTEVAFVVENFGSDFVQAGSDVIANYPDQEAFDMYSVTDNNGRLEDYWNRQYRGISAANLVIHHVGKMTEEQISTDQKNKIVGQAKFLRGLYHMRLLMNWEKIVVFDFLPESADELLQPLSEREAVWAAIEKDFTEAAADLPATWDANNKGRATKGAALSFLGKAYLHQHKWAQAEQALKQVMDLGVYGLAPDFASLFDGSNELSNESIFEIAFTDKQVAGSAVEYAGIYNVAATEMGGWEAMLPTQSLLNEMKKEGKTSKKGKYDARLYGTLFFDDPDVSIYGKTYDDVFGEGNTKIAWKKYLFRSIAPWDAPRKYRSNINNVLMRYADVLLMYAEALNEQGKSGEAKVYVDQVRARADMPATTATSQAQLRAQIMHERAVEFALEGQRFYDLRRWGDEVMTTAIRSSASRGFQNFNAAEDKFLPIPSSEKANNPKIQ
ncbi:hypothetical protein OB13_03155 [Pontibacter sp. HJ8]